LFRINTAASGNAGGPPDEIYIYRPGGTNTTTNGTLTQANYNSTVGRTAISDLTTPSGFLSTNAAGGLDISSVGPVGNTISFYVNINCAQPVKVTSPSSYFGAIQTGYNAASADAAVETLSLSFTENLFLCATLQWHLGEGITAIMRPIRALASLMEA
jgi:hypothetical protein